MVEHNVANVVVDGSNPFTRSYFYALFAFLANAKRMKTVIRLS